MEWFRGVILRERRLRDLQERLQVLQQDLGQHGVLIKGLDRDLDDLEAYVKKVMGRVTGGVRREEKAVEQPDDINQQIRDGKLGTLRIR